MVGNIDITLARRREIMTRALLRAADRLAIGRERLAQVTGLGLNEIAALRQGTLKLDPNDKRWETCVLLVRLCGALHEGMGGDDAAMKEWMAGYCEALDAVPAVMLTEGRLKDLVHHLEHYQTSAGARPRDTGMDPGRRMT